MPRVDLSDFDNKEKGNKDKMILIDTSSFTEPANPNPVFEVKPPAQLDHIIGDAESTIQGNEKMIFFSDAKNPFLAS